MKTQQATRLRTAAKDYVTMVQQACNKVKGFSERCQEMERSINISGKSKSTFVNYCRQLAYIALHYERFPLDLDGEQVMDYLNLIKKQGTVSAPSLNSRYMDYGFVQQETSSEALRARRSLVCWQQVLFPSFIYELSIVYSRNSC